MSGMANYKGGNMTDLSKYTNNDKRRQFFEDRSEEEGWELWFEEPRLNRKYMRCGRSHIHMRAKGTGEPVAEAA